MSKKKQRNMDWMKTETCLSIRIPKKLIASFNELISNKAKAAGIPKPTTTAYIRMMIEKEISENG